MKNIDRIRSLKRNEQKEFLSRNIYGCCLCAYKVNTLKSQSGCQMYCACQEGMNKWLEQESNKYETFHGRLIWKAEKIISNIEQSLV